MPFIENVVEELGTSKFGAGYSLDEATLKPNLYRQRSNDSEILLVVSPYTDEAHLLDLSTIEPAQALLAKALTWMVPIRDDYATACYTESFNWIEVMHALKTFVAAANFHWRTRTFFIVLFRSQVKVATDYSHLGELDRRSHIEAMKSGGLLKYWFGIPDADGRNLATCIWNRFEDAQVGGMGEAHRAAAKSTANLYSKWEIQRLSLWIGENVDQWRIEEWK